ncbi:hypothetical protein E2562_003838 [Oryza meyeriana var. granulata]|uniref:Uncharacterized protein n=1 Tax=Oryza meyeriana var. granulata TaxID=110450 RepID=A0A6G1CZB3_9ORYZ|nr:hypothetical protein E2562_003838 [Oryza meyeriana var. granulata]
MAMHPCTSYTAALLLAFLVAPHAGASAQPWKFCGSSGDFSPNSTYQSNLGLLSADLPKNASSSPTLFAAGGVGAPPDMVYGLALCRGDSNATACGACVEVAFQEGQQLCAYGKEVTVYYDLCYLRFSNQSFLATDENFAVFFPKARNVSAPAEVFDAAVVALLNATADYAAENSSKRFATGVEAFRGWGVHAIYALVQCTPDMSPAGCRSCLAGIIPWVKDYFSGSPTGRVLGVRCNYWYEVHPFFPGNPLLHLEAPAFDVAPPAPSPAPVPADTAPSAIRRGRKRTAVTISTSVACSIVFILIISGSVFICLKRRKASKDQNNTSRGKTLNWEQRYNIILGIAKGILYLHEDSSIRIIHRDLKANNVLLDENMNPKIADFGLARLLGGGHTQTKTARVVGTDGYMAPEYVLFGKVSPKIDIFSFGVLVLEIVTGRRNSSFNNTNSAVNLLTEVWNSWTKGTALQLADQSLDGYSVSKVLRCIHIGLLCVQESPVDRPSISSVILMLTRRRIELQPPRQPAFFFGGDFSSVTQQYRHRNYMYDKSAMARHRVCFRLAAALLLAFLLAPLAAAQPWKMCGQNGNYSANSTYQSNLGQLSATLPKNASAARTLFAKDSLGTVPDIVYALALCRGDTANASACESCVANAFQDAQQLCPYGKEVFIIYDLCYLRFSNLNFIASTTDNGRPMILMNSQNASAPAEVFDAAVGVLLNATTNYAVVNSSRRFATGEEAFDSANPTIYGLSQCTPDISQDGCRSCLGDIIAMMPQYLSRRRGGRIIGIRCNFRYEVDPFFSGGSMLRLPAPAAAPPPAPANTTPPAPTGGRKKSKSGTALAIALPLVVVLLATVAICLSVQKCRRRSMSTQQPSYSIQTAEDIESTDSLFINLSTLRAATGNFSESNRLGEGGFGSVYKGVLPSGEEIAVKRLSISSRQGMEELKNELVLVAKLQHKNLVRLVGVCLQEHEKLLVYEYMPNRSIDTILFDLDKSKELDWGKRLRIINGIARALQYLHEDSQLRIIHRDLKASNVLLDSDYTPKISDFGLARLFGGDQTREVTSRVVGTYGYMSPEYAMRGHYSVKSDVFSFGILMIEIVTGRRSSGSYSFDQSNDLLSLVWEHWTMGTTVEMMDPSLTRHAPRDQMLKCIHIGLLCVQDNPADRPMMSTVNIMLSSNTVSLQSPSKPSFFIPKNGTDSNIYSEPYPLTSQSTRRSGVISVNDVSSNRAWLTRQRRERTKFLPAAAMLAVVVVVAVLLPLAGAQPMQFSSCASGAYATNSTYQANLGLLAAALPANASTTASAGYVTVTVGVLPDRVSALALCRGDANASTCRACVAAAFRLAQRDCPSSKDATTYQDDCIVRFSDQRFLDFVGVNSPVSESYSDADNLTAAVPVAWFNTAVVALMNATVDHAVAVGGNATQKYFATAVEDFDPKHYPKIYGMAQCAPVMSVAQCRSCLTGFVASIPPFLNGKPGGRVLGIWCNLRYSVKPFYEGRPMLQLSAPPAPSPAAVPSLAPQIKTGRKGGVAGVSAGVACSIVLMLILSAYAFIRSKRKKAAKKDNLLKKMARGKCTIFDLPTLKEATENFSEKHKLGEGGFGSVYKGKLPDGQEIAVKKLIESCGHGLNQLHNEVLVLAQLQHKNLVRLQGFCVHKDEMLLVYEYIRNGSLDNFLFDASRGNILSWDQQYNIILGIVKGIMYLHEDSSIRIIHRDLKANNILLDEDMDPKIADFGLARLLGGGHTQTKTTRVVGTYGYMAPEYAIHGNVSPKIDIFSFGVLVLEIVTKRKNCSYDNGTTDTVNLLSDGQEIYTRISQSGGSKINL